MENCGKRSCIFNYMDDCYRSDIYKFYYMKNQKLKEQVICSAIWFTEIERASHRPINTPGGVVVCGHRHGHCISQILPLTGERMYKLGDHIQGFLTNKNRFVDRVEGGKIWMENGGKLEYSKTLLYSEDIY